MSTPNPPRLQLERAEVGEVSFEPHPSGKMAWGTARAEAEIRFRRTGPLAWLVELRYTLGQGADGPVPYTGHICARGRFLVPEAMPEDEMKRLVAAQAPTMLYAAARWAFVGLTVRSWHGTYLLPAVPFVDRTFSLQVSGTVAPGGREMS